ncbi:acid phosphatase [Crassisporium funariophilum]|nr:acid phosphatase [Crassisporium funariophilum]
MMSLLKSLILTGFVAGAYAAAAHKPSQKIVPGKVFDRFVTIWMENTDFDDALADPNLSSLAKSGIELNNYWAVTHPSEPNYVASVGGEYFGMDNDDLNNVPANISSVVDLLEDKGISWGEYQEDMPSTGFTGFSFPNQQTGANDYVRKHDPLIIFESVTTNPARTSNIKNFTLFQEDLANNRLPQWMFITPNMTNDGHDTNVTFAGKWANSFLRPLLANPNFNTKRTLVLLTFDENESDNKANLVRSILLGGAVPTSLHGTTDTWFYTHYSSISTISANWGLHTLGRYDVGANVFANVASTTRDRLRSTDGGSVFLNGSYAGIFNENPVVGKGTAKNALPVPNTELIVSGRTVLPKIREVWGSRELQRCTTYTGALVPPSEGNPPVLPAGC